MATIKLKSASGGSVSLDPVSSLASDITLTLPDSVGSAGQYLRNSGTAGTLEFGDTYRTSSSNQSLSGSSSFSFSIPSYAKRITITTNNSSVGTTNGSHNVRVGTGGVSQTSGYTWAGYYDAGASGSYTDTAAFSAFGTGVANSETNMWILVNQTGNNWGCHFFSAIQSLGVVYMGRAAGSVTLSGILDTVQFFSSGGAFDAGSVTVFVEG